MRHHALSVIVFVVLFCVNASAGKGVALTKVCAFRFQNAADLGRCKTLADEFASVAQVQQRMYEPKDAAWDPNTPLFAKPSVYWVQKFANAIERDKARVLGRKLRALAYRADWSTCFDANIASGDFAPSPVTIATINNYFPVKGQFQNALGIRLEVSKLMAAADAGPPVVIVPANPKSTVIGFLAVYEAKDEAQAKIYHDRQYTPAIIQEVDKIDPFLSGFARMSSTPIYDRK